MSLIEYLREKSIFFIIDIIALLLTIGLLVTLNTYTLAVALIVILNVISFTIYFAYDYYIKNSYYKDLLNRLDKIDDKYLINAIISQPSFIEGKILYNVLQQTNKSMNDRIFSIEKNTTEYREYIELWVHEIKTPIASTKLMIENNKSELTYSIKEETEKIENFVEQALFYARSSNIENDYIIKKINIEKCINNVIKRNADTLIKKKIKIEIEDINKIVYCDSKWIEFIIHQIVSNSIKYMKSQESILKIYTKEINNNIALYISDNGIGISESNIKKVFEKGYTGDNGRIYKKSTGLGLYLCKKLCDKLGIYINLDSEKDKGTTVSLIFPINKFMEID